MISYPKEELPRTLDLSSAPRGGLAWPASPTKIFSSHFAVTDAIRTVVADDGHLRDGLNGDSICVHGFALKETKKTMAKNKQTRASSVDRLKLANLFAREPRRGLPAGGRLGKTIVVLAAWRTRFGEREHRRLAHHSSDSVVPLGYDSTARAFSHEVKMKFVARRPAFGVCLNNQATALTVRRDHAGDDPSVGVSLSGLS